MGVKSNPFLIKIWAFLIIFIIKYVYYMYTYNCSYSCTHIHCMSAIRYIRRCLWGFFSIKKDGLKQMVKHKTQLKSTTYIKNQISAIFFQTLHIDYMYWRTEKKIKTHTVDMKKEESFWTWSVAGDNDWRTGTSSPLMLRKPTLAERGSGRGTIN